MQQTKADGGRRQNDGEVGRTDADQCLSSCSFWSLGLLLPASSRNTARAALSLKTPSQRQQQHVAVQTWFLRCTTASL